MAGAGKKRNVSVGFGFANPTQTTSKRGPSTLDVSAAVARKATTGAKIVAKVGSSASTGVVADMARAAPLVAPALSKLAIPLTILAAGGAAAIEGARGLKKRGTEGLMKGAVRGAADSVTLGLASWAYDKAKKNIGFDHPNPIKTAEGMKHFSQASQRFAEQNASAGPRGSADGEGPKGWANPKVQAAAQAARVAKLGTKPKG